MNEDYKPRFSFEVSKEQKQRADRLLSTYGLRKAIFGKVLDNVLDLIESHGGIAIGIMMSDSIDIKEILPTMQEVKKIHRKED